MADLDFVVSSSNVELEVTNSTEGFSVATTDDKHYTQAFTNSSTIIVSHNLGKYPSTQIFDSAGDQIEGTVRHNSINQLTVTFTASFTGTIICN